MNIFVMKICVTIMKIRNIRLLCGGKWSSNAKMFRRDNGATVSKTSLEIDALLAGWGTAASPSHHLPRDESVAPRTSA